MKQMNKLKSHTRNQRRMYRIHKQEEKIHNLELLIGFLQQENQELKEQLEEINNFINKASFVNIEQLMLDYCAKVEQQKEFIEWLEQSAKKYTPNLRVNVFDEYGNRIAQYINPKVYEITPEDVVKEVLSKYKEIIGAEDEQRD